MSTPNPVPKIAIFMPSSAIGGAEHYVHNILNLIKEVNFQPTLILPKNEKIISFFADLKVNCLIADIAWSESADDLEVGTSYLNKLSLQYRETIEVLKSLKPDSTFINLPWVDFGLGISLACHSLQIPCVNLVHLCPWKVALNKLTKQIFQDLAAANSVFFTVSDDNRIQLSLSTGISLDQIKVFYNSRDVESRYTSLTSRQYKFHRLELLDELELPFKSFISLSVGRFSHQKNFLDIITSFARIHQDLPNYYHIFLGEGELTEYYQKIVLDLGLSEYINFLGYRRDVAKFLALSDLFISTSLFEGLALSLLESAHFLCPIIAANSSSAKEIIPSSDYGLLYNPGQYHLLAKYIEYAYFNPQKMQNKALKLKTFCQEKFSQAKFKNDLENILNQSVNCTISKHSDPISVIYDQKNKSLKINKNFEITNYQPQQLCELTNKSDEKMIFPFQAYCQQILEKKHYEYLHCLNKLSKSFLYSKIILCFESFSTDFFRNYYSREKYLLLVISQTNFNNLTLNFYDIDYTYWGQDIVPDCLAKFTTYEKVTNLTELEGINLNKIYSNHYHTSKCLLGSYLKLANADLFNNLAINLKVIDSLFKPIRYYLLEKNSISEKIKLDF